MAEWRRIERAAYSLAPCLLLGLLSGGPATRPAAGAGPDCSCAAPLQTPAPQSVMSTLPRVHDPAITKAGDTYYLFCTGRGITILTSKDRVNWTRQGRLFEQAIPWTATTIPGSTDYYWAPDISFFGGKWHLYYSVSTFGKNRSAIGLAINVTLDPTRADYHWKDEGAVVESHPTDDWNAIDPQILVDGKEVWLSFGSFWSGIKLIKLDAKTGMIIEKTPEIFSLASRPRGGEIKGAVEAPYIIRRGGYYYLFVSFDFCCRGVQSTYNIRVGRSKKVTGPYVDRDGKRMLEGGGTLVVEGAGRWRGPGHNAVLHENEGDWLVYHAYDAEDNGAPKLRIEKLTWNRDGWPVMAAKGEGL